SPAPQLTVVLAPARSCPAALKFMADRRQCHSCQKPFRKRLPDTFINTTPLLLPAAPRGSARQPRITSRPDVGTISLSPLEFRSAEFWYRERVVTSASQTAESSAVRRPFWRIHWQQCQRPSCSMLLRHSPSGFGSRGWR